VVAVYSTFLTRAMDQLNLDVSLHGLPVLFCIDRAGITGDDGPSHHGALDMVLLSKIPGMTILAPSSYQELQQMFSDSLATMTGPVAIRWPKTDAPQALPGEVGSGLSARQVIEGEDICIIGVGKMLAAAVEAAARLSSRSLSTTVWDPRAVRPLDPAMLVDAARHSIVVTVEDGLREGGAGSAVRDAMAISAPDTEVMVLGLPVEHIPHGKPHSILARLGLDGQGIAGAVLAAHESRGTVAS
jgi:1-deoxy-D-xylulose-5-phosphate synthase